MKMIKNHEDLVKEENIKEGDNIENPDGVSDVKEGFINSEGDGKINIRIQRFKSSKFKLEYDKEKENGDIEIEKESGTSQDNEFPGRKK